MAGVDEILDKYKFDPNAKAEEQKTGEKPGEAKPDERVGEPKAETSVEGKQHDEQVEFDVSQLKGILGVEEDVSVEDLKTRYTGWTDMNQKVSTLDEELKSTKETLEGYKKYIEGIGDPSKLYPNDDIRYLSNVVTKYPSLDYTVASRLVTEDAKNLSDVDAIAIADAIENSEYSLRVDDAEVKLFERLGIESREDIEELSANKKRLLEVDARKARAIIARAQDEAKTSVERQTPEEFLSKHNQTVKEAIEGSRKAYEPIIDTLISKVEDVVEHNGKQLTTIKLEEEYKKELRDFALEQIGNFRMGADEESQKQVINNIQYKVWGDKRGEILSAAIADAETRITQELEKKYNNHTPTDIQRETTKETADSGAAKLIEGLPKPGWGK